MNWIFLHTYSSSSLSTDTGCLTFDCHERFYNFCFLQPASGVFDGMGGGERPGAIAPSQIEGEKEKANSPAFDNCFWTFSKNLSKGGDLSEIFYGPSLQTKLDAPLQLATSFFVPCLFGNCSLLLNKWSNLRATRAPLLPVYRASCGARFAYCTCIPYYPQISSRVCHPHFREWWH